MCGGGFSSCSPRRPSTVSLVLGPGPWLSQGDSSGLIAWVLEWVPPRGKGPQDWVGTPSSCLEGQSLLKGTQKQADSDMVHPTGPDPGVQGCGGGGLGPHPELLEQRGSQQHPSAMFEAGGFGADQPARIEGGPWAGPPGGRDWSHVGPVLRAPIHSFNPGHLSGAGTSDCPWSVREAGHRDVLGQAEITWLQSIFGAGQSRGHVLGQALALPIGLAPQSLGHLSRSWLQLQRQPSDPAADGPKALAADMGEGTPAVPGWGLRAGLSSVRAPRVGLSPKRWWSAISGWCCGAHPLPVVSLYLAGWHRVMCSF